MADLRNCTRGRQIDARRGSDPPRHDILAARGCAGLKVGIEIGGTFTDLVAAGPHGIQVVKVPSTPRSPDQGAFAALDAAGLPFGAIQQLVHGSTVATNAVLERKGARLALLVTQGFRDLLLLRRQDRQRIFDLFYRKPDPLVARQDVLEVPERMLADGAVETALDPDAFAPALRTFLARGGYDAVAICLLNSFANPAHEWAAAALLRAAAPGLAVTCSVDVTREFREFERASTTVMSAYVQPVLDAYLGRIEARLAQGGFTGQLGVMQSNGGSAPIGEMRRNAVTALLSGPAAGVAGAVRQAGLSGCRNLVTLDIGGTSADVCLVEDGRAGLARESEVGGLPVQMPMLDITTVGAGGGSLAWVDEGGLLRVGPRSAGADPGPACYGRGGVQPTLTDAQVLCGRIPAGKRLAGGLVMDADAARAAFEPLAAALGLSVEAAADSVVRIAVAHVVAAIRLVSTRRGRDPRDYVLVPYGGAGPLHAAPVAEELGIATVLVPPNAGVLSAYGLIAADQSLYAGITRRIRIDDAAPATVRDCVAGLRQELEARYPILDPAGRRRLDVSLETRFAGQAFEITVELPEASLAGLTTADLLQRFSDAHRRIYRQAADTQTRTVEIVSLRVGLHVPQGDVPSLGRHEHTLTPGPALIEDATATIWVPPGWSAAADAAGNLMMRRQA